MKLARAVGAGLLGGVLCATWAGPDSNTPSVAIARSALQTSALSELGARAAMRVGEASAATRAQVTRDTVAAAIELYPTTTTLVVGAVARAHPAMAPEAVEVAVANQPRQVFSVVAAALDAAPSEVLGVVRAASRQAPKHYQTIALLAARLVPQAGEQVLAGLAEGLPALKPLVDRAREEQLAAGTALRVPQTIALVDAWVTSAAKSLKADRVTLVSSDDKRLAQYSPPPGPPTLGPPFTPLLPGPGVELLIGGGGVVPPGGRDYPRP